MSSKATNSPMVHETKVVICLPPNRFLSILSIERREKRGSPIGFIETIGEKERQIDREGERGHLYTILDQIQTMQ